jgi:hypothetical protein
MKKVLEIIDAPSGHWVGDGFPVRSLFSYTSHGAALSPFLLLDYAGPAEFPPAQRPRGVGQHPHRGFETVTIVYKGEVAHRDSTGQGGVIGPGDVQWMTAGAGILHEEFHSPRFTQEGGALEMVQLWVNLPACSKMQAPRYQAILNQHIPSVNLPDDMGQVRVIAGNFAGQVGPARTFTPMSVWDIHLAHEGKAPLVVPEGWSAAVVVLHGKVKVNNSGVAPQAHVVVLGQQGTRVTLEAIEPSTVLFLAGEPIAEPIVGYGPFVMNTEQEIVQAIGDFNSGKFGYMAQ